MSLCYFSPVSHYTRNAILNITALILNRITQNVFEDILIKKQKQQMITLRNYGGTAQVFSLSQDEQIC